MPYLILVFGLIVGGYALLRFFMKASPEQIKQAIFIAAIILFTLTLLLFALSGRIIVAIALLVPVVMIFAGWYRKRK